MCGIVGIVGGSPLFIEGASFVLKHRGPDDSGVFFDQHSISTLLIGQDKGRDNGERLFALLMFELWRREYKVSL